MKKKHGRVSPLLLLLFPFLSSSLRCDHVETTVCAHDEPQARTKDKEGKNGCRSRARKRTAWFTRQLRFHQLRPSFVVYPFGKSRCQARLLLLFSEKSIMNRLDTSAGIDSLVKHTADMVDATLTASE